MPLILPHPITPTFTAASSLMVAPFVRLQVSGFRLQVFLPDAFFNDFLHRDFAVFEGRSVAGVYDAGAVQAVLSVLAFPVATPDGPYEALDDGEVPLAGFDLGGDHG